MILYINTRGGSAAKDQKKITVALKEDGKVVKSLSEENQFGSQVLLPLIIKLLQKVCTKDTENPQVSTCLPAGKVQIHPKVHSFTERTKGVHWEMLEGIEVETGPGSFTGLRVGVSVANALGFSLGISVNGKKMETELVY